MNKNKQLQIFFVQSTNLYVWKNGLSVITSMKKAQAL